jgi:transcriptional regulator with XRE-family HTH domain
MRDKNQSSKVFGTVLRELRLERGFTQDKLAELAKTERSHISALERAEKSPVLATILTLAEALDIPASQLIGLVEQRLKASNH